MAHDPRGLKRQNRPWTDAEVLESFGCGTMSHDDAIQNLDMGAKNRSYEERIKALGHPYKISMCERGLNEGKVTTVVRDKEGRYKRRTYISWEAAYKGLKKFYQKPETLEDLFPEWLNWKCDRRNNKPETMTYNQRSFNRYVKGTALAKKDIASITFEDLEQWAIDVLKAEPMTAKRFNTHKICVLGPLNYAVRKRIIKKNPWDPSLMEYTRYLRAPRNKPTVEQVFTAEEIDILRAALLEDYEIRHNNTDIGLAINCSLGLRVGELAALKWSDISWTMKSIFIQREESNEEVEEFVKGDAAAGYRELILTDDSIELLQRLRRDKRILSEFVFTDKEGTRLKEHAFIDKLRRVQLNNLHWDRARSNHCIRRYVGSAIAARYGVGAAQRWLGHENAKTTLTYYIKPLASNREICNLFQKTHETRLEKMKLH